jgi:TolB protein
MIQRRTLLKAATPAALLASGVARAQFRVQISGVGATQVPIVVAKFKDEERASQSVSGIIRADLERSGMFKLVDAGNAALDDAAQPVIADWRARATDALLVGSVGRQVEGRLELRFRLWDVVKGEAVTTLPQPAAVPAADLRLAAHRIADEVYEKLTGQKGVFSTRIAYVSKTANRYALWVADADGDPATAQMALVSPEPIISPTWSPDGAEIAYVSFEARKAVVHVQEVMSGRRRTVASFRGSNSAPAFSPDGKQLAVTLSRDGGSQLYLMSRLGENVRRVTQSNAIDTEAAWAPDGQSIYFVSDRGGGPQVYRVNIVGGAVERVTFQGNYNISPAVSPDGRYLAYVTRSGNAFRLMLMELGSSGVTELTDTSDDESPSFAPNSRLIIYATRAGGRDVLMTTTLDGKIKAALAAPQTDVREPTWGPLSGR